MITNGGEKAVRSQDGSRTAVDQGQPMGWRQKYKRAYIRRLVRDVKCL